MKKIITLIALVAIPAAAVETGDCSRLGALYEIRSLMMKRYSSSYDVDKAIEDAGAFRATYCYLMIASDTLVSDRVQEYAEQCVEIVTMRGWRAR